MSLTQFCVGGIFRFIDNDFKTEKELKATDPANHSKQMNAKAMRKYDLNWSYFLFAIDIAIPLSVV
ncbi:hypothetical protein CVT24_011338 [Panaeolus cyanescens]|uniref:Uncharacterized protein n=1 Tax=Panaeolus cyanescens TaxID=181874 RepID=A0A409WE27_9AGAR|nr:hypothetical protein CVT24_011338 [Panaeolus cyanescens]